MPGGDGPTARRLPRDDDGGESAPRSGASSAARHRGATAAGPASTDSPSGHDQPGPDRQERPGPTCARFAADGYPVRPPEPSVKARCGPPKHGRRPRSGELGQRAARHGGRAERGDAECGQPPDAADPTPTGAAATPTRGHSRRDDQAAVTWTSTQSGGCPEAGQRHHRRSGPVPTRRPIVSRGCGPGSSPRISSAPRRTPPVGAIWGMSRRCRRLLRRHRGNRRAAPASEVAAAVTGPPAAPRARPRWPVEVERGGRLGRQA